MPLKCKGSTANFYFVFVEQQREAFVMFSIRRLTILKGANSRRCNSINFHRRGRCSRISWLGRSVVSSRGNFRVEETDCSIHFLGIVLQRYRVTFEVGKMVDYTRIPFEIVKEFQPLLLRLNENLYSTKSFFFEDFSLPRVHSK